MPRGLAALRRTTRALSFDCFSWNSADWKRILVTFGTVAFAVTTTAVGVVRRS
jgi:hypothetical protein